MILVGRLVLSIQEGKISSVTLTRRFVDVLAAQQLLQGIPRDQQQTAEAPQRSTRPRIQVGSVINDQL